MQFLPRQEEVPGWRLENDPLVIMPSGLDTYLDRDARHFLGYELLDATIGTYRRTDGNGFVSVEIYRFPDFVKAFGAYSTRRKNVRGFIDVGNEAFVAAHSVHIWSGPFYVRMTGGGDPNLLDPIRTLATSVVARMPRAPGKPAVFRFLPEVGRIQNSETFSSEPAFGQPVLANAFTAKFAGDPTAEIDGLVLPAPNKQAAAHILAQYRAFFTQNGKLLDPITNLGEENFTGEDRYFGRTVAFRIDRFVVAFRGYSETRRLVDLAIATDQRILATIKRQLETAEKTLAKEQSDEATGAVQPPSWTATGEQD